MAGNNDSAILLTSGSTLRMRTSTSWAGLTISATLRTRVGDSSEMWIKPSIPGSSSTNAPKSMIFDTFPLTIMPRGYFSAAASQGLGVSCFKPRVSLRDPVDLEHLDLHLVAGLDHFVDLGDPRPAHLADRQQPVDPTYIDEGAEVFDRPDDAIADLALFESRPGLLALLRSLLFQQLAARDDQVFFTLIGLGDDGLEFLVDVRCRVVNPRQVDLADWQEAPDAVDVDFEAPLDRLGHSCLDGHPLLQVGPVGIDRGPLEAEDLNAFLGVEPFDDDLDARARLRQLTVFKIGDRKYPLALAAEVNKDALAPNADNLTGAGTGPPFLASLAVTIPRPGRRSRPGRTNFEGSRHRKPKEQHPARPADPRPTGA